MKVTWNEDVCSHSGQCVTNLPDVFKIENDTLAIYPDAAAEEEVRKVCDACPSGALSVEEE
jgi:uncharacterized Fe-S cluster protein YjdI